MLLTFLGLTLATTTSTELQIATNYRWSQQALYNAEAGLEAARIVLSDVADLTTGWTARLPTAAPRDAGPRAPQPAGPLDPTVGRDFFRSNCDDKGGVGYGRVLEDGVPRATRTSPSFPVPAARRSTAPSRSGSGGRCTVDERRPVRRRHAPRRRS